MSMKKQYRSDNLEKKDSSTQRSIKGKAILMLFLVLAMPLYSSFVIGESLDVKVYGKDGIDGFYKGSRVQETLTFDIYAQIDNDSDITGDQLMIDWKDGDYVLSDAECSETGIGGFNCLWESGSIERVALDSHNSFKVILKNDSGVEVKRKTVEAMNEYYGPVIEITRQPYQQGDDVYLDYVVKDRSYNSNYNGYCSGLEKIDILSGPKVIESLVLDEEGSLAGADDCENSGRLSFKVSELESDTVTIIAYDKVGNSESVSSEKIYTDMIGPVIESLKIFKDDVELSYLRRGDVEVNVEVVVDEENLEQGEVYGNFNSLGLVKAYECYDEGDKYRCVFKGVVLQVEESGSKDFSIEVKDDFGNFAQKTISYPFSIDESGPVLESVESSNGFENVEDDEIYVGKNGVNITLDIIESESGISKEGIELYLTNIDSSYSGRVAPDNCESSLDGYWRCVYEDVRSDSESGNKRVRVDVIKVDDVLGNSGSGMDMFFVNIDNEDPVIEQEPYIESVSDTGRSRMLSSGSSAYIKAEVSDSSKVYSVADLSGITNDESQKEVLGDCLRIQGDLWECEWVVESVATGYFKDNVDIRFYDSANNHVDSSVDFEVYGVRNEEANFWSVQAVNIMPEAIEKTTAEIISPRVMVELSLKSSQDARLAKEIELIGCEGEHADYIDPNIPPEILNNGLNSKSPYIYITFRKNSDFKEMDRIGLNCKIVTKTMYNKNLYSSEEDNFSISIPLYSMQVGEVSESVQEKVDDLKDTYIDGWWKYIGGLNTLLRYADGACRIFSLLRQLQQVWFGIENLWSNAQQTAAATGNIPAERALNIKRALACETVEQTREVNNEQWGGFFNQMCAMVNCKLGPMPQEESDRSSGVMGRLRVLGGGNQLCGPITDALGGGLISEYTGKNAVSGFDSGAYGRYTSQEGYMNVKDSMVLSICSMCLPGIIYNLQKYRQVQCMYIDCLQTSSRTGVSSDTCDSLKELQTCKYIMGEVFQFIPFTAFLQHYVDKLYRAVKDPFSLLGSVFAIGCRQYCYSAQDSLIAGSGHRLCIGAKIVSDIGNIASNVEAIFDEDTWKPQTDYCKNIEDRDEGSSEDSGGDVDSEE